MKIDILSDLHVDFYFRTEPTEQSVRSLYGHILGEDTGHRAMTQRGDVLVVAGDIGHDNAQNIHVLRLIKATFGYRHLLCVLGNHDYYLIDHLSRERHGHRSISRAEHMRELINREEGMYCFDGNAVEIEGVTFGGCDGWYDGEYIREHFWKKSEEYMRGYVSLLWRRTMADAAYLFEMDWQAYAAAQKEKIARIYKEADVMITHVNPSIKKEHTHRKYRDEDTTGYFTFDGEEFLQNGSMRYWIFGHTHDRTEYEEYGVQCLCNPMGYPNESRNGHGVRPMQIEVK